MVKVSIISINYNNASGLQKTIESVCSQTFTDFEYIIIDGGSTDGSKEIIENNTEKISYWVSERDGGIYNAMNKGIMKATGEYLLFLNSGDYLYSDDSLYKLINGGDGYDIIYGDLLIVENDGREWIHAHPSELTFGFLYKSSLPHQSSLIKRQLFEKVGLYSENFKIISDWEFFIKAVCVFNCTYKYIKEIIAVFNMEGISAQFENKEMILNERFEVLNRDYSTYLSEYKEYFEIKTELNNYRNSRAHKLINKIIKSNFYKMFRH